MRTAEQLRAEYMLLAEDFERTNPYAADALDPELTEPERQILATLALGFEEFKSRRTRT